MATQAQIEANRLNAQHSTGPSTPEGKQRSSQNALRHGIRAQAIISSQIKLLDEDSQEFADLLQALVDDLQPVGAFEESCVETIVITLWRQRRLIRAELVHIAQTETQAALFTAAEPTPPSPIPSNLFPTPSALVPTPFSTGIPDFDTLDKLTRYEQHLDRQLQRAYVMITKLQGLRYLKSKRPALVEPNGRALYRDSIAEALESRQLRDAIAQVIESRSLVHEVTSHPATAPAESPVPTERTQFPAPDPEPPTPYATERTRFPAPAPRPLTPDSTERSQSLAFIPTGPATSRTPVPPNEPKYHSDRRKRALQRREEDHGRVLKRETEASCGPTPTKLDNLTG